MNQIAKQGLIGLAVAFGISCSHTVEIRSTPSGAKIVTLNTLGQPDVIVGETPKLLQVAKNSSYLAVEISKPGFQTKQIVIPAVSASQMQISVQLAPTDREWFEKNLREQHPAVLGSALADLLQLQSAVISRSDVDVANLETILKPKYDNVSVFHSLLGHFYYLQSDFEKSRQSYLRALELDAKNEEATRMLKIVNKLGGR